MSLDAKYMISPSLQEYYVDKDTGLPLAAGILTFYKDQARTELKTVYRLSGSPPNYSYTPLDNPCTLSSVGTFQDPDTGDDILPYYYAYDSSGNIELYYITVESAANVPQFTREAWPNLAGTENSTESIINFVPNGQFLIHADIPAQPATQSTPKYVEGEIRQDTTILSQGGWTFDRPTGSTAKDIVTFVATGSAVTNPTANPQYSIRINTQNPGGSDTFKDLRLEFQDVNKFASDAQQYTFGFSAQSNGGAVNASIILIKNFGAGGSVTSETPIANIIIPPTSFGLLQKSFTFGTNEAATIGVGSFIQIAIRFPVGVVFDVQLTDFMLAIGGITLTNFPPTTDAKFKYQAVAGWMPVPAYDSSDLYLPLRLTPAGLEFDHSDVGKIYSAIYQTANVGELMCDGTQYETALYSSDGIPYSRLQAILFNATTGFPRYGTGANYVTVNFTELAPATQTFLSTNIPGSVTATADGTSATGFTFANVHTGNNYGAQGLSTGAENFYIWINIPGFLFGTTDAGTSGFSVEIFLNVDVSRGIIFVTAISAAALAGKYFQWGNTTTQYYVWFKVDGVGADPAPGGTGIEVDLLSTMTATDVGNAVRTAISGDQVSLITFTSAATVPAGSYFSFYTLTTDYYVWYKVNGAGVDPAPTGKLGIEVDVATAATAAQVASTTQLAINMKYFAVPDLRGLFLRGWNNGADIDPDLAARWSSNPFIFGDVVGSNQFGELQAHSHLYENPANILGALIQGGGTYAGSPQDTNQTGGAESRPINEFVNYVIKY